MDTFLNKHKTLIASCISSILFVIYPNITQSQAVYAIYDPLSVPNNKFGIHILQATPDESSPAATLVNTNGDWGYITVLIESKDKKQDKWQEFFNDLRRRHLIPIVRIATEPEGNNWKIPNIEDVNSWADFLDNLNWPIKNRYVIIFNEPNQAHEWGGIVDAKNYAETLDKFITTLNSKNRDFFVLNAGFDSSAPSRPSQYEDQLVFMQQMEQAVPGIFNKLDGWVSHSYPNPGFSGSPDAIGRGTVRNWFWELQQLRSFGVTKHLPVFITETGWKHAEGLTYDPNLPKAADVASFYKQAFQGAWNSNRIVAVTPFLLSYQETPFDHFSFKKQALPEYYPEYQALSALPKIAGKPLQEKKAQLEKGEVFSSIVAGESYKITLTFKNIGQSTWGDRDLVKLVPTAGGKELGIKELDLLPGQKIEPGQEFAFNLELKAPESGTYKVSLNLFEGQTEFDSKPFEFTTEVKSPVILRVKAMLRWKDDPSGDYIFSTKGANGDSSQLINLEKDGFSKNLEARYLLPDYTFDLTLEKPFYVPKTITQKVYAGVNTLDFGILQPDILSVLLNLKQLWQLLPFAK